MKIALLTIHYANSYGGMLQAYAAKDVLSRFGDVKILNYRTKHLEESMKVVAFPSSLRECMRAAKNIARFFPRSRLIDRFKAFQNTYLAQTDHLTSWSDLQSQSSEFDVFVSGSDQIWNPSIIESFDPAYFLNFVSGKKKVAFASSAGSYRFREAEAEKLKTYLADFSSIGVREEDLAIYLTELLQRDDIKTVLDPTLVLNASEWRMAFGIGVEPSSEPYLLVYALKLNKEGRILIDFISKRLGLRIVAIDQEPFLRYSAHEHRSDIGPQQYLELFSGASFVVTDSFHGTAFSINFNIPFITIPPHSGVNRVKTLLSAVGLEDRLVAYGAEFPTVDVNFQQANDRLSALRAESLSFLKESLS